MHRLTAVIIADDLTGSLDSVAPFASLGLSCVVATSPDGLSGAIAQTPEVLSVNLGTRELGPDAARRIAEAFALSIQRHVGPETIWLKKIDSRMKGQVAAEVTGVAGVTRPARVLLCPAIPDLGRVVVKGCLQGAGVSAPVPVVLDLPGDTEVDRPDARTDDDLDRLVRGASADTLYVGARGLAGALARRRRPDRTAAMVSMPAGPVGFCIGSRDPITLAQVDRLKGSGDLPCLSAPDGHVPRWRGGGDVLVQATPGAGASAGQVSARLARGMLGLIGGLTTLVVSGGETSAALLREAGVGVLRVGGEVLPGLPLCHAVEAPGFPAIVTKSGGFGPPDTLLRLWRAAHEKKGQPCL